MIEKSQQPILEDQIKNLGNVSSHKCNFQTFREWLKIYTFYYLLNNIITESARNRINNWQKDPKRARCLTGYMTDMQSWVDEDGHIINSPENTFIDLSYDVNVFISLQSELSKPRALDEQITYLSLANCGLAQIPQIFHNRDINGRILTDTLVYMSFYGNNFGLISTDDDNYSTILNATKVRYLTPNQEFLERKLASWSIGFLETTFYNLKELDLRACSISALGDTSFGNMSQLTHLYLSENNIYYIRSNAFYSLYGLKHLDLSRNFYIDNKILRRLAIETINTLNFIQLRSLDISFTRIDERNVRTIKHFGKSLQSLSMCHTGISKFEDYQFNGTSLRYLDISGLNGVFSTLNILKGIEDTLEVLYAEETMLDSLEPFKNFTKLKVLKLSHNNIGLLNNDKIGLTNLEILDLNNNRLITLFNQSIIHSFPKLKILTLENNNINMLTSDILQDIKNLSYISISRNNFLCTCHYREFYDIALKNEFRINDRNITEININSQLYHNGYINYNQQIKQRTNISKFCNNTKECLNINNMYNGNYLILNYNETDFHCFKSSKIIKISEVMSCDEAQYFNMNASVKKTWNNISLMILTVILLPIFFFAYTFRKNFKYFIITIRNSAMLSFINGNKIHNEHSVYNYDVFVSYCNDDRIWVLDQLLPHVEIDCNVSVCLHERDFQVGISILDNIVSCMDQSRLIMLIISQQFLLSQWCQFEMHLAQHRLLETRREDLILILLEDIPRNIRPNTLHYLMMTKTYIVWPTTGADQTIFWERMRKRLFINRS